MNLFVQQVVFINYLWKRVLARSYAFSYFENLFSPKMTVLTISRKGS